ncbi:MAG TPA: hypothetical protein VGA18_08755 [Rhodothermales bacterium]|jgi:hypothetical protein
MRASDLAEPGREDLFDCRVCRGYELHIKERVCFLDRETALFHRDTVYLTLSMDDVLSFSGEEGIVSSVTSWKEAGTLKSCCPVPAVHLHPDTLEISHLETEWENYGHAPLPTHRDDWPAEAVDAMRYMRQARARVESERVRAIKQKGDK